jgi:hypothetical protein
MVISFECGKRQGDPSGGVLFALAHFYIHLIITTHLICVFPSLANDTHIVIHASDVVLILLRLQKEFTTLKLSVQPTKCVA